MRTFLTRFLADHVLVQWPHTAMYCEATVQHKLGIELFKRFGIEPVLEKRIPESSEYLDVFFVRKGRRCAVELKYKTRRIQRPGFDYSQQGAQNHGRYDFLRDIARLERYKASGIIDEGYAVFATNDENYTRLPRAESKVARFSITDGTVLKGSFPAGWKGRPEPLALKGQHEVIWLRPSAPVKDAVLFSAIVIAV